MTRAARQIERVDFGADEQSPIVAWMTRLAAAEDGWINLVPRIADDDDERPTSLRFLTLFGGSGIGVTMGTWIPGSRGRRGPVQASLGITHVTHARAVAELRSLGIPVPQHCVVAQDHPRRGIVLRIAVDTPHEDLLAWAIRAVAALAPGPARGWRADVHLPVG